jgi:hypothetical protein
MTAKRADGHDGRAKPFARWTRVFLDDRRCLVYGAGWGRFYLVDADYALDRTFQLVLGLRSSTLCKLIADPVERIAHDRPSLRDHPSKPPPRLMRLAYLLLHWSRWGIPLRWMAAIVCALARRGTVSKRTPSEIGQTVFEVERALRIEDCYPRALLTVYLCLRAGCSCELLVGCLTPTRKMHTWCSASGTLPYEALPEHYLYQPLYMLSFGA